MENSEISPSRGFSNRNNAMNHSEAESQAADWNLLTDEIVYKLATAKCHGDIWKALANMLTVVMRSLRSNGFDTKKTIPLYTSRDIEQRFAFLNENKQKSSAVMLAKNPRNLALEVRLDFFQGRLVNEVDWESFMQDPNTFSDSQRKVLSGIELQQALLDAGIGIPSPVSARVPISIHQESSKTKHQDENREQVNVNALLSANMSIKNIVIIDTSDFSSSDFVQEDYEGRKMTDLGNDTSADAGGKSIGAIVNELSENPSGNFLDNEHGKPSESSFGNDHLLHTECNRIMALEPRKLLTGVIWEHDGEVERQIEQQLDLEFRELERHLEEYREAQMYKELSIRQGWGNQYWPALHQAWRCEKGEVEASPPNGPDGELSAIEISE